MHVDVTIHPKAFKHAYSEEQIRDAWISGEHNRCELEDADIPRELRIGVTAEGIKLELIGLVFTMERVMIHHCDSASKEARRQIEKSRRRAR